MNTQRYDNILLKVTELLLNPQNPRFNPVQHQTESILAMIDHQQFKLVVLAEHILKYGLNPTDNIIIEPYEKQWVVLEGNRRITALKLMNNPELIPDSYSKIKREFQKLGAVLENALVENIPCVVIENKELSNEWIRLKHTGENAGAGTVNWDSQQTSRFIFKAGDTADSRGLFLDYLKTLDVIPQEYKDNFAKIMQTNFDRLMSDPDVRTLLGISRKNGILSLDNGVNPYLLAVLCDLVFGSLSVGTIYHKKDRSVYIETIRAKVESSVSTENLSDTSKNELSAAHNQSDIAGGQAAQPTGDASSNEVSPSVSTPTLSTGRVKGYPINRKTLIPQQHVLSISNARIVKIFNELKKLDIDTYPNAVAVLFRVFIELSADCYITRKSLAGVTVDRSKLYQKLDAIILDFENNNIMTSNELRAAKQMSSSPTQNSSVKTFNSYVHNRDITPSAIDLKSAWDDLWSFTENIWR